MRVTGLSNPKRIHTRSKNLLSALNRFYYKLVNETDACKVRFVELYVDLSRILRVFEKTTIMIGVIIQIAPA